MAFVLDASVALGWFVRSQANAYTNRIRLLAKKEPVHVPQLWVQETVNGLIDLARRGNLSAQAAQTAAELIGNVRVSAHPLGRAAADLYTAARRYGLSSYDVTYLLLAQELHLPLASNDARLRRAMQKAGIKLA